MKIGSALNIEAILCLLKPRQKKNGILRAVLRHSLAASLILHR